MNTKGQSLIEALVALSVAVVIISAVAISVITAVNNADNSKIQNQANAYASSEMEVLHQQSRANWTTFNTHNSTYCVGNNGLMEDPNLCSTPNVGTLFIRQVEIIQNELTNCSGAAKVTVTVSWKDGKCAVGIFCHSTKLESCFTDTNFVPTP